MTTFGIYPYLTAPPCYWYGERTQGQNLIVGRLIRHCSRRESGILEHKQCSFQGDRGGEKKKM